MNQYQRGDLVRTTATFTNLGGTAVALAAQRKAAFAYMSEAFAEGRLDGIESDCLAQAALFTFRRADFASGLPAVSGGLAGSPLANKACVQAGWFRFASSRFFIGRRSR